MPAASAAERMSGLSSATVGAIDDSVGDGTQLVEAVVVAGGGRICHGEPRDRLIDAGLGWDVGAVNGDQHIVQRGVTLGEDDVHVVEVRVDESAETMQALGLTALMMPLRVGVRAVLGCEEEDSTVHACKQYGLRSGGAVTPRIGAALVDVVSVRRVLDGPDAFARCSEDGDEALDQGGLSHTRRADERNYQGTS